MAATEGYFDESYETIDDLLARARAAGARRVGVVEAGWQETPLGACYQVTAEVETADGRLCRRLGRARPGDSRAQDARPAATDDLVEVRAETRAVRAALRTAYPTEVEEGQPPHVRQAQLYIRKAAEAMGISRDDLAAVVHSTYKVSSVNDLTAEQVDSLLVWLEPVVTGEGV